MLSTLPTLYRVSGRRRPFDASLIAMPECWPVEGSWGVSARIADAWS